MSSIRSAANGSPSRQTRVSSDIRGKGKGWFMSVGSGWPKRPNWHPFRTRTLSAERLDIVSVFDLPTEKV
jgi:hypothetical protein